MRQQQRRCGRRCRRTGVRQVQWGHRVRQVQWGHRVRRVRRGHRGQLAQTAKVSEPPSKWAWGRTSRCLRRRRRPPRRRSPEPNRRQWNRRRISRLNRSNPNRAGNSSWRRGSALKLTRSTLRCGRWKRWPPSGAVGWNRPRYSAKAVTVPLLSEFGCRLMTWTTQWTLCVAWEELSTKEYRPPTLRND